MSHICMSQITSHIWICFHWLWWGLNSENLVEKSEMCKRECCLVTNYCPIQTMCPAPSSPTPTVPSSDHVPPLWDPPTAPARHRWNQIRINSTRSRLLERHEPLKNFSFLLLVKLYQLLKCSVASSQRFLPHGPRSTLRSVPILYELKFVRWFMASRRDSRVDISGGFRTYPEATGMCCCWLLYERTRGQIK